MYNDIDIHFSSVFTRKKIKLSPCFDMYYRIALREKLFNIKWDALLYRLHRRKASFAETVGLG